jgi:hypothetical protein
MSFDGHACVCAFKGRKTNTGGYRNEELVNESVGVVKHLIVQSCMSNGWEKVGNSQSSMTKLEAF